jgi:hypothetical protein
MFFVFKLKKMKMEKSISPESGVHNTVLLAIHFYRDHTSLLLLQRDVL